MRILITGAHGQLGSELLKQLTEGRNSIGTIPNEYIGADFVGIDIEHIDITNSDIIAGYIRENNFNIIFNCAAFTNVDLCETDTVSAYAVNADSPLYMAKAAKESSTRFIHISTDYVFSGNDRTPRNENDKTGPETVYGKSKLQGEENVISVNADSVIVRTAWLYGLNGKNFVKTILSLAKEKGMLRVVDDQLGNPTNAADLAHHLLKLAVSNEDGIFHCTGNGICSWYDFAKEIVRLSGIDAVVEPCTTEEFKRPAKRPAFSALDNKRLRETVGDEMREWQDAISEYVHEIIIGI